VGLSLPDQPHPDEEHVPSFVRNDIMYRPTLSVVGKMFLPGEKSKQHGLQLSGPMKRIVIELNFYAFTDC